MVVASASDTGGAGGADGVDGAGGGVRWEGGLRRRTLLVEWIVQNITNVTYISYIPV